MSYDPMHDDAGQELRAPTEEGVAQLQEEIRKLEVELELSVAVVEHLTRELAERKQRLAVAQGEALTDPETLKRINLPTPQFQRKHAMSSILLVLKQVEELTVGELRQLLKSIPGDLPTHIAALKTLGYITVDNQKLQITKAGKTPAKA